MDVLLKHILVIILIPTEHWITRSLFYWMNQISFVKANRRGVRHVSERYIAKSDPYIVMVSTPNAPGGLFYNIVGSVIHMTEGLLPAQFPNTIGPRASG